MGDAGRTRRSISTMLIEAWARRMYFVPERQHDSSQALACPQGLPTLTGPLLNSDFSIASTFNPGLGCIYTEGLPRRGYRTQPGFQPGFNPGNLHNKRFALKLKGERCGCQWSSHLLPRKIRVRNWDAL
jgi:hypothetical protein